MAVYFIECARRIKIGFTKNVPKRIQALRTGASHNLLLLGAVDGGRSLEQSLHKQLAAHRATGEWFKKNPAVMDVVEKTLASYPPAPPPEPIIRVQQEPTLPGAPHEHGDDFVAQIDRLISEFAPSMKELKAFCDERLPQLKALPEEKKERVRDAYDAAKDKYLAEFWPCASRAGHPRIVAEEQIAKKCARAKSIITEVLLTS